MRRYGFPLSRDDGMLRRHDALFAAICARCTHYCCALVGRLIESMHMSAAKVPVSAIEQVDVLRKHGAFTRPLNAAARLKRSAAMPAAGAW